MLKGMSRRVIMVDSPDPELFENAIFILRNDAYAKGAGEEDIVRQAQRIADEYVRSGFEKKKRGLPPLLCALMGAMFGGGLFAVLWILL